MKERPILFSGPMVRALLAGTKTQTRRVLPTIETLGRIEYPGRRDRKGYSMVNWLDTPEGMAAAVRECRYGQPGDRLWVRESFEDCSSALHSCVLYKADGDPPGTRWTPSIHMPRWASRITLEVTGVRVERLRDISTHDCWAEGIPSSTDVDPLHEYEDLWTSINGPGSWEANPWVWVVEFRKLNDH